MSWFGECRFVWPIEARYLVPAPDDATPSLAQILGLSSPDDPVLISAGLAQLDPAATFQLALVSSSDVVKARVTLAAIAANRGDHGGRIILADSTGIFTVHVQVDRTEDGETVTSSFTNEGFNGKYPYAARPALDLFQDADETDHLELRLNKPPVRHHDRPLRSPLAAAFTRPAVRRARRRRTRTATDAHRRAVPDPGAPQPSRMRRRPGCRPARRRGNRQPTEPRTSGYRERRPDPAVPGIHRHDRLGGLLHEYEHAA